MKQIIRISAKSMLRITFLELDVIEKFYDDRVLIDIHKKSSHKVMQLNDYLNILVPGILFLRFDFSGKDFLLVDRFQHLTSTSDRWFDERLTLTKL